MHRRTQQVQAATTQLRVSHVLPGVREWQSLLGGNGSAAAKAEGKSTAAGGGFVYYGPGRCLSKLPPKHLAGLSVNCQVGGVAFDQ